MEKEFKEFRLLAAATLLFYNVFALWSGFTIPDASEKFMIVAGITEFASLKAKKQRNILKFWMKNRKSDSVYSLYEYSFKNIYGKADSN